VVAIEHADHRVDAGGPLEQLGAMSLHQTAGHHHALQLTALLALDGVADHAQTLFLAGFQEAAGVHHDRVGLVRLVHGLHATLLQQGEHLLAVHEVLRAAKADEGDAVDVVGSGGHRGHPTRPAAKSRSNLRHSS